MSALNTTFHNGLLHKSHSEPINIQKHPSSNNATSHQIINNTPPSGSTEGFAHFMQTQADMEKYFAQRMQKSSFDRSHFREHHDNFVGSADNLSAPHLEVTTALVMSLPNSSSMTSLTRTTPPRALPSPPNEFSLPSQFSSSPHSLCQREKEISPVQNKSSANSEPIYSVSKKQMRKTSQSVAVMPDCDPLETRSDFNVFAAATVAGPALSASPLYLASAVNSEQLSQLQVLPIGQDEDPYRRSTSNKVVDAVITTKTSWEQGLSGATFTEGIFFLLLTSAIRS